MLIRYHTGHVTFNSSGGLKQLITKQAKVTFKNEQSGIDEFEVL